MSPSILAAAGGGQPHNNLQPYLTLNFCIAQQGIFPGTVLERWAREDATHAESTSIRRGSGRPRSPRLFLEGAGRRAAAADSPPSQDRRPLEPGRVRRAEGETFRITLDGRVVLLTLIEVTDGPISLGTEQFTLVFRGPRELVVRDGLYIVRHPTAGSARLFLQPGNDDDVDGLCEASFNLMR